MTSTEFSKPDLETPAWVDLRRYDQSDYDRGRSGVYVLLWWLVQAIAFPLSPHFANGFRCWLLRRFGATVGEGVIVRPTARFTYPWKVHIGDYCWIGDDVVFYSLDEICLGHHCVVSQKSYLCTGSHDIGDRRFGLKTNPIILGNGVWVATDCFVAAGVTIGSNTVVGARSSVFGNLPAGYVCLGSPCRAKSPRTMTEDSPPES
ncbi:hormogonium polysaccharide biosynthesis acetyltransferase HpsU [Phormidium yuhuli AB48]|uniref:Hormogonium polysaccharide biosynthesis acetyltransferase HpsU n=1 Tax=Phormidium yuhuli AB48 TaxID=2940671 RepID=A0ABY5AS80_9CYAN|nr:hormogonium polysaccharide biosynthesis acetyltransferase HpsU [Phormidium yuhuli]USR91626.1 hormogonium polysaccharide biosynthesis acetyltransferase HpsU [Phormidium yuhuli AB48]